MSDELFVATRKGLLTFLRSGGQWRLARRAFLGEPVSMLLLDRRDGGLYAALHLGHFGPKLWRSLDSGQSWQELAAPAFPVSSEADGPSVAMIWSLESGGADQPATLWAGTIPGALFRSSDRGESWQLNEALWQRPERAQWFGGGYDQPGIHSICVDPRDSARLRVAVSCGGVWCSEDAGASWACRTQGMRAAYMPEELAQTPEIQDPHRMVACPAAPDSLWVQHHNGIFHSTDGAAHWQEIREAGPSTFGFAVAVHPHDPATAWFVPAVKDECRVPVEQRLVVTRTRDAGHSFEVLSTGLPQADCFDLVYRHGLQVDASGRCLALGSTTGHLWLSDDQGDSWQALAGNLPPIYALCFA
ncbi:WD40/YVTN/BNR-like repeat-containing protein [Pseudomonas sp. UBA2684]|uniref:WD40/YVTN/BNR-like repeat-containing protein n=1 Tax=Pseudomonas sp. UBA2684 TaxID=1947311 RepID=UPI000E7DA144|nr:exo-alpha-sialidase [Pseudomonas sp. UBA2684]HBX57292.1 sialidase [Pseudomonas sp.]|tara:strand:+ start:29293 stop:30369 length:1077 start_codon:yes stop_codon:yes gene_type:complete